MQSLLPVRSFVVLSVSSCSNS